MLRPGRALIVMAREPEPGATKTRLVPRLSPEAAARLYECFLLDALELARSLPGVTPFVAVSPVEASAYFHRIAPNVAQVAQVGESLGERLVHVLAHCLNAGFDHVAAIGSDVPTLPIEHLSTAFDLLADETVDMVLGPSDDGGYHLIGWKRPYPRLVREVPMSTPHVLEETLELAAAEGVRVALLPGCYDVDVPADLDRVETAVRAGSALGRHTRRFFANGAGSR